MLNKQDKYEEFHIALFCKDEHEKPFQILKFFATMDAKGRAYWGHQIDATCYTD